MENRMGKHESSHSFPLWGSKITADSDCSHKIRRCLFLDRKAMKNLDSVLKSRDITLLTKVCIVKAMVFPVVMWKLVRAGPWRRQNTKELMSLNCDAREHSWNSLGQQGDQTNLREINPEYALAGLMLKLKLQYFGHLMWIDDSLKKSLMLGNLEGRRRRGHHRMRWLDSITDAMNMNLGQLQEMCGKGTWGTIVLRVTKSQTWMGDWTTERTHIHTCNLCVFFWKYLKTFAYFLFGLLIYLYLLLNHRSSYVFWTLDQVLTRYVVWKYFSFKMSYKVD